ncbi:MAG: hypothetical protein O2857_08215, partial [Planctomycetota bacterium]|nr:hypothetical protein [Planctomycetota bacterium]
MKKFSEYGLIVFEIRSPHPKKDCMGMFSDQPYQRVTILATDIRRTICRELPASLQNLKLLLGRSLRRVGR